MNWLSDRNDYMKCQLDCEDFDDTLFVDFRHIPREGERVTIHDVPGQEDVEGSYIVTQVRHWVISADCDVQVVIELTRTLE